MRDFFGKLLDPSDFIPQREVGNWSPGLVWLHNVSDGLIWLTYLSISMIMVFFAHRCRQVPFHRLFLLFAAFLLACGFTHFLAVVVFYAPVYRLAGLLKLVTALFSGATVVVLVPTLPRALAWVERLPGRLRDIPPPVRPEAESNARLRQYMVAVLAATLALLVRGALDLVLQSDHAFVMSLLAVVAVAWQGGFGPALTTLALSLTGTVYFFVEERNTLQIASVSDQIAVGLFFICGFIAALLGEAQRASGRQAVANLRDTIRKQAALEEEVTRRREVEAALRLRETDLLEVNRQLVVAQARSAETLAVLDSFMQNAPIGMAFCNTELRYVRVNKYLADANQVPIDAHLGKTTREIRPAHADSLLDEFESVLADGQAVLNRIVGDGSGGRLAEGAAVWQYNLFPVRREGSEPIGVGIIAQDVTARVQSEQRLRRSEERYRGLLQAVPQMVWTTDATGRVTFYNLRWVDYTGIELGQDQGGGWMAPLHPDDRPGAAAAWQAALQGETPRYQHEFRVRRAGDGVFRWMLAKSIPLRGGDGLLAEWVGTLTDIDDQKRQAERLEQMVRERTLALSMANEALRDEVEERGRAESRERAFGVELRRSNQELEQFAYVASHDLQEPLRKIQAFGDRLQARFHAHLAEQGREYIDRMLSSATRMRRLIDDLLLFSRVTTRPQVLGRIDLNEILQGVLSDLEIRIQQTRATIEIDPLPAIEADPMQMRQVFQNLIGNALKFAAPGVPPRVRIFSESIPPVQKEDEKEAEGLPPREWVRISFADNGIGFDEKYLGRIFQVFQRLHGRDEFEGTGIGLAICRKVVERLGGAITARSRPGQGATFFLTLPVIQRPKEKE